MGCIRAPHRCESKNCNIILETKRKDGYVGVRILMRAKEKETNPVAIELNSTSNAKDPMIHERNINHTNPVNYNMYQRQTLPFPFEDDMIIFQVKKNNFLKAPFNTLGPQPPTFNIFVCHLGLNKVS